MWIHRSCVLILDLTLFLASHSWSFYITFSLFYITADKLNRHCAFSQRFKNTLLSHQNFFLLLWCVLSSYYLATSAKNTMPLEKSCLTAYSTPCLSVLTPEMAKAQCKGVQSALATASCLPSAFHAFLIVNTSVCLQLNAFMKKAWYSLDLQPSISSQAKSCFITAFL